MTRLGHEAEPAWRESSEGAKQRHSHHHSGAASSHHQPAGPELQEDLSAQKTEENSTTVSGGQICTSV